MPWTKEQKRAQRSAVSLVRVKVSKISAQSSKLPLPRASVVDVSLLPTEPPSNEELMLRAERASMALEDLRGHVLAEGARIALLGRRVFLEGEKVIVKESWWPIVCPPLRGHGQDPRIKFTLQRFNVYSDRWTVCAAQGPNKGRTFYNDIPSGALEHA